MGGSAVCSGIVILTAFLDFDRMWRSSLIVIAIVLNAPLAGDPAPGSRPGANARPYGHSGPAEPVVSTINYFALCVVNGIDMAFVLGGSVLHR